MQKIRCRRPDTNQRPPGGDSWKTHSNEWAGHCSPLQGTERMDWGHPRQRGVRKMGGIIHRRNQHLLPPRCPKATPDRTWGKGRERRRRYMVSALCHTEGHSMHTLHHSLPCACPGPEPQERETQPGSHRATVHRESTAA